MIRSKVDNNNTSVIWDISDEKTTQKQQTESKLAFFSSPSLQENGLIKNKNNKNINIFINNSGSQTSLKVELLKGSNSL